MLHIKYIKGPSGPLFLLFLHVLLCFNIYTHNETVVEAYYNLAHILQEINNIEESLENYQKALQLDPIHLPTLLGIGQLYIKMKEYDKAITFLEIRLKINEQCHYTHFHLAQAWQHKKDIEKAQKHYQKAIATNQEYMPAYENLIPILPKSQAIQICKKALDVNENHIKIREKLIELLIKKKKLTKALQQCEKLITLQPSHIPFYFKKAYILTLQNKFDQAIKIFETMLKKEPNNKNILYNIAHLHKKNGQYEKAIYLFKDIEAKDPGNQKVILGLAQSYLALGNYSQGWRYMRQYNNKTQSSIRLTNIADITGKIILIQGELYGDQMIQLIRYAKLVKNSGAKRVIVQSPDQLIPLLQQCPYIDEVISIHKRDTCPFHKLVHISSLPCLFNTTLQSVPNEIPYLFAEKETSAYWKNILQKDTQHKIGLYITKKSDISSEIIMELAKIKNTSLYILHPTDKTYYLKQIQNTSIVHTFGKGFTENSDDILQLTAILAQLDLIICCDSFVAHLAGALGIPTYVLLPNVYNWQWPIKTDQTPWYPTIKLCKETENGKTTIKELISFIQEFLPDNLEK